jgi:hypothetical protein
MITRFNTHIYKALQGMLSFMKQNPACLRLAAVMLLVTMACSLPGAVQKTPVEKPPAPTIPSAPAVTVTPGTGSSGSVQLPAGDLSNALESDRLGNPHTNYGPPGAYTRGGSQ